MFIRAVEIRINSGNERFGFRCKFDSGLNIIKGRNSSGKSTLVNTLMYALGLEELIGVKGERALTSAVRDRFQYDGRPHEIQKSAVLVELQNSAGNVVTFRRPIRNDDKSTKLVEAFDGAILTGPVSDRALATPLFLHDPGAALYEEGFLKYLESFLGLQLPRVQSSTGGLTRLYPQVVAAALFIEQKRGWTDYIANIPFYQILGAPTRVVQYLLGLECFELEEKRALNEQMISRLQSDWANLLSELTGVLQPLGIATRGIPKVPTSTFSADNASIVVRINSEDVLVSEAVATKAKEWDVIEEARVGGPKSASPDVIQLLNTETVKLERLAQQYEELSSEDRLHSISLQEFTQLLNQAESDLRKNKTTRKLHDLGAQVGLRTAEDHCPTCGSEVENTLLPRTEGVLQMDLQSNIDYLEAQIRMLKRQITGLEHVREQSKSSLQQLGASINEQRAYVISIRKGVVQSDATLEASIRKQVFLEREIRSLQAAEARFSTFIEHAKTIALKMESAEKFRKSLPSDLYSETDRVKITLLEKNFRANASSFGYTSAEPSEVTINRGTLLPALGDITLREVLRKNVKSESSASDFVRLIWAFLLAIYQTSSMKEFVGNHPGFLLFDEPGQHSMSEVSQNALMRLFCGAQDLQSVVAASFDESEDLFLRVTEGSKFHLIELPDKIIAPMAHDGVM
ncbi:AAA family ATPase [Chromobacterium sp. IIBBL 290-4]|uniref:AAA family ATPase n=1 Tax=Chromobacterium sp. IIBBL 290-4 TaxID=2953890 RepID=UPI0020B7197C|nr:AAA family ATPase [Chromobacterium sp. IIBBL 290-4]UTH75645.1 AAA family ATPase [Chromobacterium sp. IIBBL 290-4]